MISWSRDYSSAIDILGGKKDMRIFAMIYRDFGETGMRVSALGFGCMRLPMTHRDGKPIVDDDLATPLLRRAVELGVNFFDTAWFYCSGDSQRAVGAALAPVRERVLISTKLPLFLVDKTEDYSEFLERSLEQMGLEYLDINHFHGLNYKAWKEKILPLKLIDEAENAKSKGLVRHLSFSFHGDAEKMCELVDTGAFSSILGQYNLVDQRNKAIFSYANSKGLGVAAMGPLMGGALISGGRVFLERMGSNASSVAEMGLRFVWGQPNVDTALSGMSTLQQLEDNAEYAKEADSVPASESAAMLDRSGLLKDFSDVYCTGCDYCDICPEGIRPGSVFQLYILHYAWELDDAVRLRIANDRSPFNAGPSPSSCTSCGRCAERCPQKIDIPSELRRVWPILQAL